MVSRTITSLRIPKNMPLLKVSQTPSDLTFPVAGRRPLPWPRWISISQHVLDAPGPKLRKRTQLHAAQADTLPSPERRARVQQPDPRPTGTTTLSKYQILQMQHCGTLHYFARFPHMRGALQHRLARIWCLYLLLLFTQICSTHSPGRLSDHLIYDICNF